MRIFTLLIIALLASTLQAQTKGLDFYLEKAQAFSPLINQSQNEKKIIGLDLEQMKRILSNPEINLDASVLFAPIISHDNNANHFEMVSNGATNYTGYDLAITNGGQYQTVVSLKQPLFTGASLKTFSNKASIGRQINDNRISLTIHELEKIVTHQYIFCLKAKRLSDINIQLMKELEGQLLIMQKLVENAIYKQSDLVLMQIEYDNYKLNYESSRSEYKTNLYDLNLLCGINDTATVDLQELELQLNNNTVVSSGFLDSFRLDSLIINAEQKITNLKYKPQVNLFADAGLNAVYLPSIDRFGFSTGITFSWNIFDGNQKKIQQQRTNVNIQTIDFEKRNFITQREVNKNKILNQLNSLEKRIILTENQISKYDQLLKDYHAQLSQAEISVIDYKNIVRDFAVKKQDKLILDLEKQALIISYNYWNY
jgi:outer membrane protein TolC